MSGQSAYRSEHPDVLAEWDRIVNSTWSKDVCAWSETVGFDGKQYVTGASGRVTGFPAPESGEIPVGWREIDHRGVRFCAPDKRRKAGKDAAARLVEFGERPTASDLPGMPDEIWVSSGRSDFTHRVHHVAAAFVHNGAVWIRWDVDADRVEATGNGDGFLISFARRRYDPAMWEKAKLSEFFAAQEAHDAEKADAPV